MLIGQLKEQLKDVPDDLEAGPWMKTALLFTSPALSFEDAGKAIRVMLNLVGKPTMNYNQDASGKALHHRTVIWKIPLEKHVIAAQALADVGITSVKSDAAWYFTIRIPFSAYVTAFYTSDDPEVWKVQQEKAVAMAAQKAAKKLETQAKKQAQKNAEWEENNKEWREKMEREKALRDAQKEEEQRLIALGMNAQKAAEQAEKITVEDVELSREIVVEGD